MIIRRIKMEFTYDTSGTCSTQIVVDVDENTKKINSVKIGRAHV